MKISNPIYKPCFGAVIASMVLVGQNAWAWCERPQVSGYDYVHCLNDDLAVVSKDGKYGFIDKHGKTIIPLQYDEVNNFSEGLAVVNKDEKYGFIDVNGKVVVPLQYDYANSFSEGWASVYRGDKWGFIDKKGKVVLPITLSYQSVGSFF